MDRASGPNWLLRTLIIFSVGVHAALLVHLSGIYRSDAVSTIEMTLQNIVKPSVRDIPRPRPRPTVPESEDQVKKLNVIQRPLPRSNPLAMAPMERNLPNMLMEGTQSPDVPGAPDVDACDWVPDPRTHEAIGELMTAADYLDMVRLAIESSKRYPEAARAKGRQGRVTVRFVLAGDGSVHDVAVIKSSRDSDLDMAAQDAVRRAVPFPRPPSNLFTGDLALELTIVFELT